MLKQAAQANMDELRRAGQAPGAELPEPPDPRKDFAADLAAAARAALGSLSFEEGEALRRSRFEPEPEQAAHSTSEVQALKKQVRELERLLGKKTMEVEILKEAIDIARETKLISRTPLPFEDDSQ